MQVGVHCTLGNVPHDTCRACATQPLHPCMLTPDLLEMMRERDGEEHLRFSPTRILGCHRQEVLQAETDWYVDIDDGWPLTRGHMVHAMMEDARYPGALGCIREARLWTTLETRYGQAVFGGKPDLIVVKGMVGSLVTCKVVDYKSKTAVDHSLTAALPEHVHQVNMYAWLVSRTLPDILGWDVTVEVDELEVEYVGFNKPRRFTSAGELTTRGKMLTRRPRTYDTLTLAPIPLYSLAATERAILRRVEARLAPRTCLPDVLPEPEQWKCERCPVNELCWKLKEQEQEAIA